jgi:mannose-6-phosphate isomerase-like protein (cupin superfamily)
VPEPVAPRVPTAAPGEPRSLSIPDLAEQSLAGRDPVRTVPIGCSGVSRTQLLVVRETHTSGVRPDEDEMLYLVAGEATLKLGDKEQPLTPGWFSIVPRGTPRSVTRKGRNPAIFLSIVSGQPCGSGPDR